MAISNPNSTNIKLCCPIHEELINTYPKPDECPICTEQLNINIPLFPCCHWVCKNCIVESGKQECPICRKYVDMTKDELKKLEKRAKQIKLENDRTQMEEDRRFAEQLHQQLQQEERNYPRNDTIRFVVDHTNLQEILGVLNALSPIERVNVSRGFIFQGINNPFTIFEHVRRPPPLNIRDVDTDNSGDDSDLSITDIEDD